VPFQMWFINQARESLAAYGPGKERRRWKKARCERIEIVRVVLKVVDIMAVVFKAVKRLLEWRKKEKRAVRMVM
jgi:hypothetical protein